MGAATMRYLRIADYLAVLDPDDPFRVFGRVGLMGDQDYGVAFVIELLEYLHDLRAGFRIEIASRLVRKDN